MWTCPYCGGNQGLPFRDSQLSGMLCLAPDCGRFDACEETVQMVERGGTDTDL